MAKTNPTTKPAAGSAADVPQRLEDVEEYRQALAKLNALKARLRALDVELQAVPADAGEDLDEEALALLRGESRADQGQRQGELAQTRGRKQRERAVLARAVELQQGILEETRVRAARLVRDALMPGYAAKARAFAEALVNAGRWAADLQQARDDAERAGVGPLPYVGLGILGELRHSESLLCGLLRADLIQNQFLTGAEDFLAGTPVHTPRAKGGSK